MARQSRQTKVRSFGVTRPRSCCRSRGLAAQIRPPPRSVPALGTPQGMSSVLSGDDGESRGPHCCEHRVTPWSPGDKALPARSGRLPGYPPCLLPSPEPLCSAGVSPSPLRSGCPLTRQAGPQRRALPRCPPVQPRCHLRRSPSTPAWGSPGEPVPGTGTWRGFPSPRLFAMICWRDSGVGIRACPLRNGASVQD